MKKSLSFLLFFTVIFNAFVLVGCSENQSSDKPYSKTDGYKNSFKLIDESILVGEWTAVNENITQAEDFSEYFDEGELVCEEHYTFTDEGRYEISAMYKCDEKVFIGAFKKYIKKELGLTVEEFEEQYGIVLDEYVGDMCNQSFVRDEGSYHISDGELYFKPDSAEELEEDCWKEWRIYEGTVKNEDENEITIQQIVSDWTLERDEEAIRASKPIVLKRVSDKTNSSNTVSFVGDWSAEINLAELVRLEVHSIYDIYAYSDVESFFEITDFSVPLNLHFDKNGKYSTYVDDSIQDEFEAFKSEYKEHLITYLEEKEGTTLEEYEKNMGATIDEIMDSDFERVFDVICEECEFDGYYKAEKGKLFTNKKPNNFDDDEYERFTAISEDEIKLTATISDNLSATEEYDIENIHPIILKRK